MNIFPFKTYTLPTAEPLAQVKQRLANHIEKPKLVRWHFSRDHAPYQGTMTDLGFEIHRIIHYRNSFLPNIQGQFSSLPTGTAVHITMQLHPLILVFMCAWLGIWYMAMIPIALFGNTAPLMGIGFLGLPIVVFGIFLGVFHYEAERSHQDLTQILRGQDLAQQPQHMSPLERKLLWGHAAMTIAIFLHLLIAS